MSMGSLRVPRTIEKRVSFLLEGRTLGPYFRRRCRASVSVSPNKLDCGSTIVSTTSASDGQNWKLGLGNDAMGEGPRNMSSGPVPISAATNTQHNRAGLDAICKTREGFGRMSELDLDLADALTKIRIGRGYYLLFGLFPDSVSFGRRLD